MAKSPTLLMLFPVLILLLVGAIFAVPADAQSVGIKEGCVLSDDLDIEIPFQDINYKSIIKIKNGSTISPSVKSDSVTNGGVEVKRKRLDGITIDSSWATLATNSNAKAALENKWGLICLVNTINSATGWIFFVLMAVSFVLIIVAAFFWVTSGTNPENQKTAGKMILAALIGIAIAILARIIPGIVIGILS